MVATLKVIRCTITTITMLVLLLICIPTMGTVQAQYQYFPPVPPPAPRVVQVDLSYPEPQEAITINVTRLNPEHTVREVTLYFKRPILAASLSIYQPIEKPPDVSDPGVALTYFTIRAQKTLLDNVESSMIVFAIDKSIMKEKGVEENSMKVEGFFKGAWQEVVAYKVGENNQYLIYKIITTTPGQHFVVIGPPSSLPMIIVTVLLVATVLIATAFLYFRIRRRGQLQTMHS